MSLHRVTEVRGAGVVRRPRQRHGAFGPVAVLGDDDLQFAHLLGVVVQEQHRVGVGFDGTGFAEVGHGRPAIHARFAGTVDLAGGNDCDAEFAREKLEATGDARDLLAPGYAGVAGVTSWR